LSSLLQVFRSSPGSGSTTTGSSSALLSRRTRNGTIDQSTATKFFSGSRCQSMLGCGLSVAASYAKPSGDMTGVKDFSSDRVATSPAGAYDEGHHSGNDSSPPGQERPWPDGRQ